MAICLEVKSLDVILRIILQFIYSLVHSGRSNRKKNTGGDKGEISYVE